jgi:hypothetical protein
MKPKDGVNIICQILVSNIQIHLKILFNHTPELWLPKSKCKRRKKKKKKPGREMVMWLMGTYPAATRLPG